MENVLIDDASQFSFHKICVVVCLNYLKSIKNLMFILDMLFFI